jgi:hypothetical protein
MSLVCRRFLPLAQEILYHQFLPGYSDDWGSIEDLHCRFPRFLRAVAPRPDWAASVSRVHIDFSIAHYAPRAPALAEEVLNYAAEARGVDVSDFLVPFRETGHPGCDGHRFPVDELLGLLLSFLPRLRTLSLTAGAGAGADGFLTAALAAAGVSSLPIETLDITGCDGSLWGRLDGILELAAAKIRNLFICLCDDDGLDLLASHGPYPNLRTLRIVGSRLVESGFASLLAQCGGLETFSYETGRSSH